MAIIGEWMRRLAYLVRRRAQEDALRLEMEAHRAQMAQPRAFGNTLRLREQARDAWGWSWLDTVVQDTRFALRTLRHSPGFALTAILTLALGIGVNIGMFSLVNGVLLRPLYERPDEVVMVQSRSTTPSGESRGVSYPNYVDLREGAADVFANLAAFSTVFAGLDVGEGPRRTLASAVTASYFETFGHPLALGRSFTAEEERIGARIRVAIIGHSLWEQRGADPGMLGRTVRVNGEPFTVVGVAPKGFTGTSIPGPEVWLPLGAQETFRTGSAPADPPLGAREAHELAVVGRLRAGASIKSAAPVLTTVARRLELAFPAVNGGYTLEMSPPSRLLFMPGPGGGALAASLGLLLMVMPAIVLLVTCLNLVDLLLARGQGRRQEMAIRSSLGGGRGRLTRQLVTEGLLLALAGGAVGLLLSIWATNALTASVRPLLPVGVSLPELALDWRVFVGTVGFSLAATLLFSAWPAWALTGRAAATDLKRQVGDEGRRLYGGIRVGACLVIGQVALSLLLLATGGLFLMSALSAATADPGFRLDGGLLAEVDPNLGGYDEAQGRQLHRTLVDRLRTVPGVEAVTIASRFPFSGAGESRLVAPAGAADARSKSIDAVFSIVGRDYARVLGLPILGGRDFTDAELAPGSSERVAIIDAVLAQRLWPGEGALGRLIQFVDVEGPENARPLRVVGIIPALQHSLGNPLPSPHVYVPSGQHYESAMTLQLRIADADAEQAMLATITRVIRNVDARAPVVRVETWRDHLDASLELWLYRTGARVFSAFAAIALLLAIIGVYGVKSYVVSRRTREFGIRIAIGAHPRDVLWQVLREGGHITAVGIAIGLLLAFGVGQLLQGFLYGVNAVEPTVLVAAPLILLAASLLASYMPALRATKVDPTVALRSE
jgi:predicted permease